jgi:hypothetical protein
MAGRDPGGRYFAEFDDEAPVTREGQLLFSRSFRTLEDDGPFYRDESIPLKLSAQCSNSPTRS